MRPRSALRSISPPAAAMGRHVRARGKWSNSRASPAGSPAPDHRRHWRKTRPARTQGEGRDGGASARPGFATEARRASRRSQPIQGRCREPTVAWSDGGRSPPALQGPFDRLAASPRSTHYRSLDHGCDAACSICCNVTLRKSLAIERAVCCALAASKRERQPRADRAGRSGRDPHVAVGALDIGLVEQIFGVEMRAYTARDLPRQV